MSFSFRFAATWLVLALVGALFFQTGCKRRITSEERALRTELKQAMRGHSYEKASAIARQILQDIPRDNGTWERLTRARLGLHDLPGASQALEEWRSAVRRSAPKRHELAGDIAMQEADAAAAAQAWSQALRANPKNLRVLKKLARSYRVQERWAEEDASLTAMLRLDEKASTFMLRAHCRRQQHRWAEALEDLRGAQQLAPNDAAVRQGAKLFERLEKFLAAIRELDARIALTPQDDQLITDRALLFLRSDDPELALRDADAAARMAPWALRPKLFRSIAWQSPERIEEAASSVMTQNLRLEKMTPQFLETIARLDSEISVERDNADLYVARAWQCNDIGQPLFALEDVRSALEKGADSVGARVEGSYALAKLGRVEEAYAEIKRATELDPNFATAWDYRGDLEIARNDPAAAIESLSRALAIAPNQAALQKREQCYMKTGQFQKAEEDHRALETLR